MRSLSAPVARLAALLPAAVMLLAGPGVAQRGAPDADAPEVTLTACAAARVLDDPDPHPASRCQIVGGVKPDPLPTTVGVCRTNDHFGAVIAVGGDFDGDGRDDLAIAGSTRPHERNVACDVWVLRAEGGPPLLVLDGDGRTDLLGAALAFVPDLDGDGRDELAVGAPHAGTTGRVYVVGGRDGTHPARAPARMASLAILEGVDPGGRFGAALTVTPGDDGPRLWVGAPGSATSDAHGAPGSVFAFGGADLLDDEGGPVLLSARHARRRVDGDRVGARFGFALVGMGPRDGAPHGAVAVGAPRSLGDDVTALDATGHGQVAVYGDGPEPLAVWSGEGRLSEGAAFGHALASGGDVDGDGVVDLLVGAPLAGGEAIPDGGAAVLLSGADGSALAQVAGSARERLGASVALAGDLTADGRPDLVLGAPLAGGATLPCSRHGGYHDQGGPMSGAVLLVDGASGAVVGRLAGETGRDRMGWSVAARDLDGDGLDEVVTGALGFSPPQPAPTSLLKEVGRVYVFDGGQLLPR